MQTSMSGLLSLRVACVVVCLSFLAEKSGETPADRRLQNSKRVRGRCVSLLSLFFRFSFFPFCPFFSVLSSSTSPFSLLVSIREMFTFVNALSFMKRHTIVCVHRPNLRSRNGHCSSVKGQVHFLRLQGCIRVALHICNSFTLHGINVEHIQHRHFFSTTAHSEVSCDFTSVNM